MNFLLLTLLTVLLVTLQIKKEPKLIPSFGLSWVLLLTQMLHPLPYLANDALWMLSVTYGTFFLGKSFKSQLWPIFIFAGIAALFGYFFVFNLQLFLLLYAGFNYLIQFGILIWNFTKKWNFEQILFSVYSVGGIGSLLTVLLFGYDLIGIYLVFYYSILNLLIFFRQKFEVMRERFFQ